MFCGECRESVGGELGEINFLFYTDIGVDILYTVI